MEKLDSQKIKLKSFMRKYMSILKKIKGKEKNNNKNYNR